MVTQLERVCEICGLCKWDVTTYTGPMGVRCAYSTCDACGFITEPEVVR